MWPIEKSIVFAFNLALFHNYYTEMVNFVIEKYWLAKKNQKFTETMNPIVHRFLCYIHDIFLLHLPKFL
jgi:hypothetical protein